MSTEVEKVAPDHVEHHEQVDYEGQHQKEDREIIVDSVAAQYVDSSVVITPEENKRLKRMIYKRYVYYPPCIPTQAQFGLHKTRNSQANRR
jgi:hypothetical protein